MAPAPTGPNRSQPRARSAGARTKSAPGSCATPTFDPKSSGQPVARLSMAGQGQLRGVIAKHAPGFQGYASVTRRLHTRPTARESDSCCRDVVGAYVFCGRRRRRRPSDRRRSDKPPARAQRRGSRCTQCDNPGCEARSRGVVGSRQGGPGRCKSQVQGKAGRGSGEDRRSQSKRSCARLAQ